MVVDRRKWTLDQQYHSYRRPCESQINVQSNRSMTELQPPETKLNVKPTLSKIGSFQQVSKISSLKISDYNHIIEESENDEDSELCDSDSENENVEDSELCDSDSLSDLGSAISDSERASDQNEETKIV